MESFKFKKKFGQNFLIDDNIIRKIVSFPVKDNSIVIEIGPGDGRLTKYLCSKFDKVIAYEIDEDVKDRLLFNLSEYNNYEIYFKDFLKTDLVDDLKKENYEHVYVVANLPYYITTPIIEKIIESNINPEMIRIMIQKEVGDRFCAEVSSKEYGSITVYLNYNYDIKKEFIVSRKCFYPSPNVDSMVISLYKKDRLVVNDLSCFYNLIRDSFKFKRKTIRNNLKDYDIETVEEVLKKYGFDLSVRAEQLPVNVFVDISNNIDKKS